MGRRILQRSTRRSLRPGPALAMLSLLAIAALACSSTPIAKQSVAGNAGAVQALLDQGADPDGVDRKSRRALELAVHFQRVEVVKVLVAGGADVKSPISRGMSPLHYAAMRGNPEIVKTLIAGGASIDGVDRHGYTPLGQAIARRQYGAAAVLLGAGGRLGTPRDQSAADRQLLHAVLKRRWASATQLVGWGANPDFQHKGRSVRELARRGGDPALMAALGMAVQGPATAQPPPTVVATAPVMRPGSVTFAPPVTSGPAMPPLPASIDFGRYHALVIGNDEYEHLPKLRTATHDADAVAKLLTDSYGHEVHQLENATRAEILRALVEYRRKLGPEDNLLIYYAGHGWLDEEADRGYWLPVDAREDDVVNWVDNGAITSAVRAMEAKHVLVVADSCYSGKLTRGITIVSKSPNYIERLASRRARVVLTSGGLEPVLDSGGKGRHSVFASAFLDVLAENRGVLEGHELFTRLRRPVAVNSDQVPMYSDIHKAGHDGGDFLFVRRR